MIISHLFFTRCNGRFLKMYCLCFSLFKQQFSVTFFFIGTLLFYMKKGKHMLYNYIFLLRTNRVYCSKRRDHNGSFQSQHMLHGCTRKFTSNSYFLVSTPCKASNTSYIFFIITGMRNFRLLSEIRPYDLENPTLNFSSDFPPCLFYSMLLSLYTVYCTYTVHCVQVNAWFKAAATCFVLVMWFCVNSLTFNFRPFNFLTISSL